MDRGESKWQCTEADPALSPKMVILLVSPPNAAMLAFIHLNANSWSLSPILPGHSSIPKFKNPKSKTSVQSYSKFVK